MLFIDILLTLEIMSQCLVTCNSDQCFQADLFDHKLTFAEELACETIKQSGLNVFASEAEAAQVWGSEVCGDIEQKLRWEA